MRRLMLAGLVALGSMVPAGSEDRYAVTALADTYPPGFLELQARSISDSGLISGHALAPVTNFDGGFTYTVTGGLSLLPAIPNTHLDPGGINDFGQVVGGTRSRDGSTAFIYTPGQGYQFLPNLGSTERNLAYDINNAGQVVGHSSRNGDDYHPFFYSEMSGMRDLGTFGGEFGGAISISENGWVAGSAQDSNGVWHAFVYREEAGMVDLGPGFASGVNNSGFAAGWTLGGKPAYYRDGHMITFPVSPGQYWLAAINNANVMVGVAAYTPWGSTDIAILATESAGVVNLNTLIPPDSGWILYNALDINNRGQIVGRGHYNAQNLAYRLDPIPPRIAVRPDGTNVVVSWTPAWPGVILESASTLTSTNWTPVPSWGTNVVTVASDSPARFFRLNLEALRGLCCAP